MEVRNEIFTKLLISINTQLSVFTFVGCGNNDNETTTVESNTTDIIRVQQIT